MSKFNRDEFYELQYVEKGEGNLRQRHRIILSLLRDIIGKDVLEIGGGTGVFAQEIASKFNLNHIYVVDISKEAIRIACEKGIKGTGLNIDTNNLPYEDSYFNTIICSEVIEHLVNPDHLLEEIYRVMRPNGYLIITTPNLGSWYNRILLLFGCQPLFNDISIRYSYNKPFKISPTGHLRLYTFDSLKFLLKKYNFSIIKSLGIGINEEIGYGLKYKYLTKIINWIFKSPSFNSGICILAKKVLKHGIKTFQTFSEDTTMLPGKL